MSTARCGRCPTDQWVSPRSISTTPARSLDREPRRRRRRRAPSTPQHAVNKIDDKLVANECTNLFRASIAWDARSLTLPAHRRVEREISSTSPVCFQRDAPPRTPNIVISGTGE
jgi:hypothetical protein